MPHAYNSTDIINNFKFFETGYILIDEKRYDVEEISINTSRDMTPYHVAAQRDPIDQRPGKNKIEFSFKRAFSDAILANMYDTCCVFSLLLINNDDPTNQQQVVLLEGCRLTQDNIGPVNAKALLEHFGSVGNVINALTSEKKVKLRNDWNEIKVGLMKELVKQKFSKPDSSF